MFEFLKDYDAQDVVPAIHHSIQLVRQQWAYGMTLDDRLAVRDDDTLTPEQKILIKKIISEIESREQTSIEDLDPDKTQSYITQLTDISQSLSNKQFHADENRGKKLLEELRKMISF